MNHHGQVHVVEVAQPQHLRLAAEELELAGARLAHAPGNVAVLLGRHRDERHAAGQLIGDPGIHQAHRAAQEPRHLGVVATRVSGAGLGIGFGMAGHDERVELAEQRERGPRARAAPQVGAYPGDGEAGLGLESQRAQHLFGELRRLELLEAQLGVAANLLAQLHDLVAPPIDRLPHPPLELVPGHRLVSS